MEVRRTGGFRRLVRRNLRLLDRPGGVQKARSTVHAFVRDLEKQNQNRMKLPALALFEWSEDKAEVARKQIPWSDRIWEMYPTLMDLSILHVPPRASHNDIDEIFDDLLSEVRSARSFQDVKKCVRRIGLVLGFKTTAGSLFCLFERLTPFVR